MTFVCPHRMLQDMVLIGGFTHRNNPYANEELCTPSRCRFTLAPVIVLAAFLSVLAGANADNLVKITDSLPNIGYTADPIARVFDGTLYVYTSVDAPNACRNTGKGMSNFCMPGYKVMWTKDLRWWKWKDVFNQDQVPWGRKDFTMWAPDVLKKGDKYFLFFPHRGRIGVSSADNPLGPFTARDKHIAGANGIDPTVIAQNGQWYLYTSRKGSGDANHQIYVWELSPDFSSASNPRIVKGLKSGYKEGPHVYKRNGIFYLLYSRVVPFQGYQLELARSNHPSNQFWSAGVAVPTFDTPGYGTAPTNHGSVVAFKGKSYVFYHKHLNKNDGGFKYRTVMFDRICYTKNGQVIAATHGINGFKLGHCGSS